MVDASVIVSIVLAVISLFGTLAIAGIGFFTSRRLEELKEQRQSDRELDNLTAKYSVPLLLATYELQARLYELIEYPISNQHLETKDGLEDIKLFTCYTIAQFLGWVHLFKVKTQYFMFSTDQHMKKIGEIILRLDEEFDRRRDDRGRNVGVWPGPRVLVSERMLRGPLKHPGSGQDRESVLTASVKDYHDFVNDWDEYFKGPMGYFCQWIDDMVAGRLARQKGWDNAMRCTQHNLVDMVNNLNQVKALNRVKRSDEMKALEHNSDGLFRQLRRCEPSRDCDCSQCFDSSGFNTLIIRGNSRFNDQGVKSCYDKKADQKYQPTGFTIQALTDKTWTDGYKQGPRIQ